MSNKTEYLANWILTQKFITNSGWLALMADEDTELNAASYARQEMVMSTPSGGRTQNTDSIVFPTPEENWGEVTRWEIYDAEISGNPLYGGELPTSRTINANDTPFTVGIGGISITEL